MLQLKRFTFNPFQENTYLLFNGQGSVWIIDPGMENDAETRKLVQFIKENNLTPKGIINTHAHIDHILGIDPIKTIYPELTFAMHTAETPVLNNAIDAARRFGFNFNTVPVPDQYLETGVFHLGDDELEIRLVPGHSPGSIAFYYPAGKWVVSGDALFKGSIGRTDLPLSDPEALPASIHRELYTLPLDTEVYPGHGPATTIADERMTNPFVNG